MGKKETQNRGEKIASPFKNSLAYRRLMCKMHQIKMFWIGVLPISLSFFFSHIWGRFVFVCCHVISNSKHMNWVHLILAAVSEPPGGSGFIAVAFVTPAVSESYVKKPKIILSCFLCSRVSQTRTFSSCFFTCCAQYPAFTWYQDTHTEASRSQVIPAKMHISELT